MKERPPSLLPHLAVLGLVAVLLLSACSSVTPSIYPTLDPSAVVVDATPTLTPTALPTLGVDAASLRGLHLEVWHAFAGDSYTIFSQQVALFNAVNEWGITLTETGFGDYLTLFEAVQAALESGELPGMVVTLPEQALAWQADGLVVELVPYLRDPEYGMGSDALADLPALFWEGPGAPAQRSARFLYYNQTWAHELGFTSPPAAPDEFRQQACAANAAFKADADLQNDGYGGWVVDFHWQTAYSWLLALGGGLSDGEAYTFQTAENQAALEYLKVLYDDNCAWLSTDAAPYEAFAGRKALFVTGDLAEIPAAALAMTAAKNPDEWTLIPFPGVEAPLAVAYGPSYTILSSTPEEQLAAWLFVRWVLSPDNQALWVEATGLLPLRLSVLDLVAPYRLASPGWDSAAGSLAILRSPPQLASWRRVRYVLADGLDYIFQVNLPPDRLPSLLDSMQVMAQDLGDE
jgi:multiple sugar transport system substrate-binding protein